MANEIQFPYSDSGATLYAQVRDLTDGTIWNGTSFESYLTANIANYDIPLTEQGTASKFYTANFPATDVFAAVTVYKQAGGSPAESDELVGAETIDFNGSTHRNPKQAMEDIKLDHLVAVADSDDPVDNSIIAKLAASDGDWSGYSAATDSLEALRDRGDSAWITAVGFSTHSAADVADAVWDENIVSAHGTANTAGLILSQLTHRALGTNWATDIAANSVFGYIADTGASNYDRSTDSLEAIQMQVAGQNDISSAQVLAQVATGLNNLNLDQLMVAAAVPADIIDNSVIAKLVSKSVTADWDDFDNTTDSLQALRDRGDSAWATATGFSTHTAANVADAVWDEAKSGHTAAGSFGEEVQSHATSAEISALNDLSTAEVNAEVDTALTDIGLDHLVSTSVAGADVANNSVFARLVSASATADWDDFSNTTDSLQAIRDRGDSAWITAVGFSTHTAADVWASGTRTLTGNANLNDPSAAAIADAVWDEAVAGHTTAGTFGEEVQSHATSLEIAALNDISTTQVNTEVDNALVSYGLDHLVVAAVTGTDVANNSIVAKLVSASATADWDDFVNTTDSLQAIRDRGDAAWITADISALATSAEIAALNDPTAATIADAVWDETLADHLSAGSTGSALNAAGSSGDPWATSLPGAYGAGTAGYIIGNNIDAAISSRSTVTVAQVNTEVDTALADIKLDHLVAVADSDDPADNSIIAKLAASDGDWSGFDNTTDSLEAIRDRGDAAWTGGGGAPTASEIADAVWDEAKSGHTTAGSFGEEVQLHALSTEISALNDLSAGEVNAQVDSALTDIGLDHLVSAAVTGTDVANNSVFARLVSASATADWDDFVNTTDSLQAIRDRGDTAWVTAVGFSTHSAADVWASGTRTLSANTNLNDPTVAAIADAVWDEVLAGHLASGSTGAALNAAGSSGDPWATALPGAYGAGTAGYIIGNNLDAAVSSRSTISVAQVNAEVDTALVDIGLDHLVAVAVTGTDVVDNSVIAKMVSKSTPADWDSFTNGTDALEAIRDRGDGSWTTAVGFSTHSAADVWVSGTRTLTSLGTDIIDADSISVAAANEIADALLDRVNGIESGFTPRQSLRIMFAALAAKLSGAETGTVRIRDVGDTKDRITATVDSDGNRTAITLDAS